MKIGIDFGSTYSTFSVFDHQSQQPKAIELQGDQGSLPTVISQNQFGDIDYGTPAKNNIGDEDYQVLDAFKMLLNENNINMLKKRGYSGTTGKNSPRYAAKLFLQMALKQALIETESTACTDLVICVPESWTKTVRTLDGRAILRDILREIAEDPKNGIDLDASHIRIVSEPEAASSYFAYEYKCAAKKPFNGHLLLIDYGGGTLDITLTQISTDKDGKSIDIKYCVGDGAGENHPDASGEGSVGVAGIAYMQGVITYALRERGLLKADAAPDYTSVPFMKAVKKLEEFLLTKQKTVNDTFSSYEDDLSFFQTDSSVALNLPYAGQKLSVTYKHLYVAYEDIIAPVLREKLGAINQQVQALTGIDPTSPRSGNSEKFKIALVGGFGTYWLVQNQIQEIYNFVGKDSRTANINIKNREKAISLGAALLAEGVVNLKRVARYSVGLILKEVVGSGKTVDRRYFGIRYGQEIVPNKICYLLAKNKNGEDEPGVPQPIASLAKAITELAIDSTPDQSRTGIYTLRREFITKLKGMETNGILAWHCGFSMDENEFLTIHLTADPCFHPNAKNPDPVPLSVFTELVEPFTEVRIFEGQ